MMNLTQKEIYQIKNMHTLTNISVWHYVLLYLLISHNIFYFEYAHELANKNLISFKY